MLEQNFFTFFSRDCETLPQEFRSLILSHDARDWCDLIRGLMYLI